MKARTVIALNVLIRLNWVNKNSIDTNLLDNYFSSTICSVTGEKTGTVCFDLDHLSGTLF
jgi:hypothetical protein